MTQPTPSALDLAAAAALALDAQLAHCEPGEFGWDIARTPPWTRVDTRRLADTVAALLAEVERLREERDSALERAEMSGEQTVAYEAEVARLKSGQPWEELFAQRDEAIAERDRLRAETAEAREILLAYRADDTHAAGDLTALPLVELAKVRAKDLVVSDNELDRTTALYRDLLREARAERDRLRDRVTEAEAVIVRAQDALGVDHPVWVILDDYDGSMDSVRALVRERDEARAERDRYAEVVQAAQQWRDAIKPCVCGNGDPHRYLVSEGETALVAAVDRLTPPGVSER